MKIDTTTVRLVLAVAEEGSISRAADRMQLAVAAASRRLTDLEQQLGTRLFKRQPHGVRITESGLRLLGHIRQMDNLMQRLEDDALVLGHGRDGRILIGAPKAAIIEFLACDLAALQAKYPEITLQMQEENSKIVQQLLRDRVIDIGIFEKTSGFIDLPQADYGRDRLVLVYSRAHFEFTSSALPLDAVLSCPLVTLGQGSAILATLQRAYQSRGRVFHANYTVSGFDTMLAVVRQGLGVGLMPPAIFESFQPEAALGAVALEGNWHERRYVLSFVEGQAQEQTLRNVVAELLHRI